MTNFPLAFVVRTFAFSTQKEPKSLVLYCLLRNTNIIVTFIDNPELFSQANTPFFFFDKSIEEVKKQKGFINNNHILVHLKSIFLSVYHAK